MRLSESMLSREFLLAPPSRQRNTSLKWPLLLFSCCLGKPVPLLWGNMGSSLVVEGEVWSPAQGWFPLGQEPKPSLGQLTWGHMCSWHGLLSVTGLEKSKVVSGWKMGRVGRGSRRKTYKGKQRRGMSEGKDHLWVLLLLPPVSERKEGDLIFWKGVEYVPSFLSRLGKG